MDPATAERIISDFEKTLTGDEKDTYANAKKERSTLRRHTTLALNNLDQILSQPTVEISMLKTQLKKLNDISQRLEDAQIEFEALIPSEQAAEATTVLHHEKYGKKILDCQYRSEKLMAKGQGNPAPSPNQPVQLPKVALPEFYGKSAAEFQTFINLFVSMVDRKTLTKAEKLTYLKLCLKGEAKVVADGYTEITDANYDSLLQQLRLKYGQERFIQRDHYNGLLEMQPFSWAQLPAWFNTYMTHVRTLESLGLDIAANSGFLVCLGQKCMPSPLYQKWEEEITNDTRFSAQKFFNFLEMKSKSTVPRDATQKPKGDEAVKPKRPNGQGTASMLATSTAACSLCNQGHKLEVCPIFVNKSVDERHAYINTKKLCKKCLVPLASHASAKECIGSCQICSNKPVSHSHHTLLHFGQRPNPRSNPPFSRSRPAADSSKKVAAAATTTSTTLLKTCHARAVTNKGNAINLRLFFDDGSDTSFCTMDTQQKGQFRTIGSHVLNLNVFGTGTSDVTGSLLHVEIPLLDSQNKTIKIKTAVWDGPFCSPMKAIPIDPQCKWPHLKNLNIQDSYPRPEQPVDVLIGLDQLHKVMTNKFITGVKPNDPVAQYTKLGWIVYGPIQWTSKQGHVQTASVNKVSTSTDEETNELVKSFWAIENDAIESPLQKHSNEDQKVLDTFNDSITYDENLSQYKVVIPYTDKVNSLESNKSLATKAFYGQEKRLESKPEIKEAVNSIVHELEGSHIIEKVPYKELEAPNQHYLIWHTVLRPGHPTTPVRIVHNASRKDKNGLSLNDCQPTGPNLYPTIPNLLIKWRRYKVAIIADISKMFLRLNIEESQKDMHRFLFRFEKHELLQVWRYCTVMFGEKSSPFLANASIKFHASTPSMNEKCPRAVKVIKDNEVYMDDTTTGEFSEERAIQLYKQLVTFFQSMGMSLHKFISNSNQFLSSIDQDRRAKETNCSVLGVEFNTKDDSLFVKTKQRLDSHKPVTKRLILSKVASIFDPIGVNSPLLVKGKSLIQKLWMQGLGWDEPVTDSLRNEMEKWVAASAFTLTISRPYTQDAWPDCKKTLHVFSDASEDAYSACVYLEINKTVSFVIAKSRVKLLKVVSLPRMELLGALIASRLKIMVLSSLQEDIDVHFWSDSTIVLNWINSEPYKMKTFVGNRVAEIQTNSSKAQWHWTPTDENPADLPSRGIWPLSPEQEQLYLEGPSWLPDKANWPIQPEIESPKDEMKKSAQSADMNAISTSVPLIDISKYSSLTKLLKVMAFVLRFAQRRRGTWTTASPSVEEREKALMHLIKTHQKQHFAEDIKCLTEGQQLKRNSPLISLNPILDDYGMLRIGGRLQFSNLSPMEKHQLILAPSDHLTKLIIDHCHKEHLHCGAHQTLNTLRKKYWILKGGITVKKHVQKCVPCQKINKRPMEQKMAPLPDFRCQESPPFTHTGIDFAGPLYTKDAAEADKSKVWIALFTCAATRAVHLEMVDNMTTESFLAAFTRFASRRGMPSHIYSDNAKQFIRAEKEIEQLWKLANSKKVVDKLAEKQIEWHYNPPNSPHWGGLWERLVRSVKNPLKKVVKNALLTKEELYTTLCQIERMVNSRPLTAVQESTGIIALTPAMILIGRQFESLPMAPPPRDDEIIKRWRYRQELERQFWNAWTREYLPILQQRTKWAHERCPLKINDIVLLMTDGKRQTWPLGRVTQTFKGRDGLIRSADIISGGKTFKRSIQNLVHLEMDQRNTPGQN